MKCIVLRPFPGPGGARFQIGERVDTAGWKNREQLIAQRYIQPARLSSGMEKKAVETPEEDFRAPVPVATPTKIKKKKILAEV